MKRLNERIKDYNESLDKLTNKCLKYKLNLKLTENIFLKVQEENSKSLLQENIVKIIKKMGLYISLYI